MELSSLIEPIIALARDAGHAILEVYSTDFDVQEKDDASPLTQADLAAHRRISAGLRSLTPDIPICWDAFWWIFLRVRLMAAVMERTLRE